MQRATLSSLPDVLDAKDVASVLGIGYIKSLKLLKYGKMNYCTIR